MVDYIFGFLSAKNANSIQTTDRTSLDNIYISFTSSSVFSLLFSSPADWKDQTMPKWYSDGAC